MSTKTQDSLPEVTTDTWWDNIMGKNIEQAKSYIRSYGEGVDFPSRMELLNTIFDGESLLDVGCGSGCEYENIIKYNRDIKYKGTDYAETFILACKDMFPEADWEVQSAEDLKEDDNSFDTVLLRHMLECLPHYETAIEEAWRVARKRVVMVFWIPPSDQPTIIGYDQEPRQANRYNKGELFEFLKTLNYKNIVIKENVGKSNMFIVIEKS